MILPKNRGNVLLFTLIALALAMVYVGMVMSETSTVAQNTNRAGKFQGAQAAAAGAVDYAYSAWLRKIAAKHDLLDADDLTIYNPPAFPGYEYTEALQIQPLDQYGVVSNTPSPFIGPVPGYTGWWGHTYTYAATARLRATGDPNAPSAGARRLFHYTEVPLFQCMFFFAGDLEIYNPAQITISGLIHSNGSFYFATQSANPLKILGQATYVNNCYQGSQCTGSNAPLDVVTISNPQSPTWAAGGTAAQLSKSGTISAMGADLETLFSDSTYTNNPNVSGTYHELIEPPDPSTSPSVPDPDAIAKRRLYNVAANTEDQTGSTGGLIIQVTGTAINANNIEFTTLDTTTHLPVVVSSSNTTRIAVGNGATLISTGTAAKAAFAAALSKKLANSGSSAISGTSLLYDDRQNSAVNVVDVDMAKLQSAISTYITNFSDVIYIYDNLYTTATTAVVTTTSTKNAYGTVTGTSTSTTYVTGTTQNTIRLINGYNITETDGLTIASQNPVYIQGNFNTSTNSTDSIPSNTTGTASSTASGYTSKAVSVVSDALTLLSSNWNDANSCTTGSSNSTSSSTSSGSGSNKTTTTTTVSGTLTINRTDVSNRDSTATTYNVALLGGYMPSTSSAYSGGAINYPRFLEDWSNTSCIYYGSMVELFPSNVAKAPWRDTGSSNTCYLAPNRFYNFDTKFSSKSPPGSVSAIVLSRGLWSKY